MKPRKIDASHLEGGGQLLRLALTLSSLSSRPIEFLNIRGRRPKPGLREQHLTCIQYLATACDATIAGALINSSKVTFIPSQSQRYVPGNVTVKTTGAGAISLIIQAVLPFLLFTPTMSNNGRIKLVLHGGTNGHFAPSIDYIQHVLFPNLRLIGIPPDTLGQINIGRRGWSMGNVSNGEIELTLKPLIPGAKLQGFHLTQRGNVTHIEAVVLAPTGAMCSRVIEGLSREAAAKLNIEDIRILTSAISGHQKRLYLLVIACTSSGWRLGRDWLYNQKLGKTVDAMNGACDTLVKSVVRDLEKELQHGSCLDEWMEDQIVVFQALAEGRSSVGINKSNSTLHTQTARWVAGEVLGIDFEDDGSCEGAGFVAGAFNGKEE